MVPATLVLTLPGPMPRRGFRRYVWRVEMPRHRHRVSWGLAAFARHFPKLQQQTGRMKS